MLSRVFERECPFIPPKDMNEDEDVNDAREELDAPEDGVHFEIDAEDLENRSVKCGCMSGPKFPSINDCQVFRF